MNVCAPSMMHIPHLTQVVFVLLVEAIKAGLSGTLSPCFDLNRNIKLTKQKIWKGYRDIRFKVLEEELKKSKEFNI